MVRARTLPKPHDYDHIRTEGIKYTGAKTQIVPYILWLIDRLDVRTVLDGFSGTTRVSQALKQAGYEVYANDIAEWSRVFGACYLLNKQPSSYYRPIIDRLNELPGKDGWFTEHYGGYPNNGVSIQADRKKKVWQVQNTRKLDSIREEIDRLGLDPVEKAVLLTSLILALDKVDSTLGHYVSYLREWSPRSYNQLKLRVPKFHLDDKAHRVYREDIFKLQDELRNQPVDLAYYDPPYGSSNEKMPPSRVRYASYYHLWTTVCLNDKPKVWGAANRRADTRDEDSASVFEDYRKDRNGRYVVINAIERLLKTTPARYAILSYSSKGRVTTSELQEVLYNMGIPYQVLQIDHSAHIMKSMTWTNEWTDTSYTRTKEFLFLISLAGDKLPPIEVDASPQQLQLL